MSVIEQAILRHDKRGMARIAGPGPNDACAAAASLLLKQHRRVLILTGFYVNGVVETDGPPGALAVAQAIAALGGLAAIVADRYAGPILRHVIPAGVWFEEFPITGRTESMDAAKELAARWRPTLVVSVERCGASVNDRYLNMRGADISRYTARLDSLLQLAPSIAIGDGGNEIGMGNVATQLTSELGIAEPCRTRADSLILCAVSNWGAYGLVAALSKLLGKSLLPSSASEETLLERLLEAGAVDGISGAAALTVDGFDLAAQRAVLDDLHGAVAEGGA